jgi:hypothetical protein
LVTEGDVQNAVVELLRKTVVKLPKDVEAALRKAYASETDEVPKMQLKAIIDNIDMAIKGNTPMCQDTGVTIFYATVPRDCKVDVGKGIVEGVRKATKEVPLRPNAVHPITRKNPGDNVGESRTNAGAPADTAPIAAPVIRNMTCITSNTDVNTHGDSEGPLARQGAQLVLQNSIMYAGYGTAVNGANSNECFDVESATSFNFAIAGGTGPFNLDNNVIACQLPVENRTFPNGDSLTSWVQGANPSTSGTNYSFNGGNFLITDPTNANVRVLRPNSFFTAASIVDAAGATLVANASTLGAVQQNDDWTTPWAFGLRASNADQPLWFAP